MSKRYLRDDLTSILFEPVAMKVFIMLRSKEYIFQERKRTHNFSVSGNYIYKLINKFKQSELLTLEKNGRTKYIKLTEYGIKVQEELLKFDMLLGSIKNDKNKNSESSRN